MYIAKTQKDMLKHDSIPRKLTKNRRCNMFCTHAWFTPATKIHTLPLLKAYLHGTTLSHATSLRQAYDMT